MNAHRTRLPWGLLLAALSSFIAGACAHGDAAADASKNKSKRHPKRHAAQDGNAVAASPDKDTREPAAEPRALGPNTWQVEADGSSLEEAARHAAHAAVVWCGQRKQVPLPESDSNRPTAQGVRLTFVFHCIQVEEEVPPPMPVEIEPMPLDPD